MHSTMKRTYALLPLFLMATYTLAANVCGNDTIVKVLRPDSIIVTETDSATQIKVFGNTNDNNYRFNYSREFTSDASTTIGEHKSNWDFTTPFMKNKTDQRTKFCVNAIAFAHVGIVVPLSKTNEVHSNIGFQAGFDVINVSALLPSKCDELSIGIGVETFFLKQRNNYQWIKQNGQLATMPFDSEASHKHSRLDNFALTLPVHYLHEFKNTYIGLSIAPEFSIRSAISNRYRVDSHRVTDNYKNLNKRKFDVAFRLEFGKRDWGGLYLQFNPYKTFTGTASPNFKMLTIGYTL